MDGKKKKDANPLSGFLKAVSDILSKPQITLRYLKGKLSAKGAIFDTAGFTDTVEIKHYNLEKKVIYKRDPKTGEEIPVPMTQEEFEEFSQKDKKDGK